MKTNAEAVWEHVQLTHPKTEDFESGDLESRVLACSAYELEWIPVAEIDPQEWAVEAERVEKYVQMDEQRVPPIVVHKIGDQYSIVDGTHRVNAAVQQGRKQILAYIGVDPIFWESSE